MQVDANPFAGRGCPVCGSDHYPHSHNLGVILNARVFCPDGQRHEFAPERRWVRTRDRCTRCGEWRR